MSGKVPKTRTDLAPISEIKKVTEPIKQENIDGAQINPATEDTLRAAGVIAARVDKSYVDFCYVEPNIAKTLNDIKAELDKKLNKATTPTKYTLTITNSDEEYSQALPANTKQFSVHLRDMSAFRLAYETGKVATPTEPYETVPAGSEKYVENIEPASLILYIAAPAGTKVAEIEAWA